MNKMMLKAAVAAVAIVGFAGMAQAQSTTNGPYPGEWANPNYGDSSNANYNPYWGQTHWAGYTPTGRPSGDTSTAVDTVTNNFTLQGEVAKDCSFFGGANPNHTIDLGAIGVRNDNNETTANLFNQISGFTYDIATTSAGCNFNNTVTVTHNANGLSNPNAGGFDSNQFTDHIPYTISIGIAQATTSQSGGQPGAYTNFTVAQGSSTNSKALGAWRSSVHIDAQIPAQSLGLVAGTYSDTIEITLQAAGTPA